MVGAMDVRSEWGSGASDHAMADPDGLIGPRQPIRRILLAIDSPAHSTEAIRFASELARSTGAEVVVLHVREWILGPKGPFDEGEKVAARIIGEVARRLKADGVDTTVEIRSGYFGHTPRQIVNAARARGADLIVMGMSGASDHRGILLGSVTDKVLQLADVPVLVARSHPADMR